MHTHRLIQIQLHIIFLVIVFGEQLPDNVIPIEYKLKIITNLGDEDDTFNFKGSVLIHVKCVSPTETIRLHNKNLKIDTGKTVLKNLNQTQESLTILETAHDLDDLLTLIVSPPLQTDLHYLIDLHFEGDLEEKKVGYYRSFYWSNDGVKKWVGVTYFKPNHARRAFPCFDELTFKAQFSISLGRSADYKSVSNMPLLKTEEMEDRPGWKWDHFETTPPMSTYNVGFTITSFNQSQFHDYEGLKLNLTYWSRDVSHQSPGNIAMGFSAQFLNVIGKALDMNYTLPKMDIVVIPEYAVPVRECWGLIIWQEEFLLQETVALFGLDSMGPVANQMVRQWFENLVTIKSWSDSWFAEGFCMFVVKIAVSDFMSPKLELFSFDITVNLISVFDFDSLENTQAVSEPSSKFHSIDPTVDNLTKKTSLLIRMLSHFVGQENLRKVIQQYLKMYKFKNAGSEELLQLTNSKSRSRIIDVKTVMNSWFTQPGFPLVTVTRNYEHGTLEVKQERFFKDTEALGKDWTKWWIPLTYTTECELNFNKTIVRKWLSPDMDSVTIKSPPSPADWVIFNIDASGLYMVDYDETNWRLIVNSLNGPFFELIPPLNRVLLIDNAAGLAWIGRLKYEIFLNLLRYVAQETELQAKHTAINRIYELNYLLKRKPIYGQFINYIREILESSVGIGSSLNDMQEDAPVRRNQLRSGVINVLASVLFTKKTLLCLGDAAKLYSWSDYLRSKVMLDYQSSVLRSLVCTQNETLLSVFLEKSLNEKSYENEDVVPIVIAIAGNKFGFDLVTEFLSKNIKTIHSRISPHVSKMGSIITEVARNTVHADELVWLQMFIATNRKYFKEARDEVDAALDIAKFNIRWHNQHYATLETYLADY